MDAILLVIDAAQRRPHRAHDTPIDGQLADIDQLVDPDELVALKLRDALNTKLRALATGAS